ncbi:MAG: hypothetical protein AAB638_03250 [Patescibacteria group bacterium]
MAKTKEEKSIQKETKQICFVISPFGDWFNLYYKDVFRPAIESAGLEAHRVDDLYGPNIIIQDVWEYTQKAKIILAVLTGKNPNVFYELGLAHALPKPVILVAESIEDVPFDIKPTRVLCYDKNKPDWGKKLSDDIQASIREILKDEKKAIPAIFLRQSDTPVVHAVTPEQKEMLTLRQELTSVRRELEMMLRNTTSQIHNAGFISNVREAELEVKNYIKQGLPNELIISRLRGRVPSDWIRRQIDGFRKEVSVELPF